MKTNQVVINNSGDGMEKALNEVDRFSEYQDLDPKESMHLRLLAEETMGMVRAITGVFSALFWLEGENKECRIHLTAKTEMNSEKKEDLLAASSSGINSSVKGFMGKIRNMFEIGIMRNTNRGIGADNLGTELELLAYGRVKAEKEDYKWSLQHYVGNLSEDTQGDGPVKDELEQSIVATIADDVKVGIDKDKVEMTILKKF